MLTQPDTNGTDLRGDMDEFRYSHTYDILILGPHFVPQ